MVTSANMGFVSYETACQRHFDDAEFLMAGVRTASAAQLYGFCAECGVKWLLIRCGAPTGADGSVLSPWKVYIEKLALARMINDIETLTCGRTNGHYVAMIRSITAFVDWSIDHRYCKADRSPLSFPRWRAAARDVRRMIEQAMLDGVPL